MLSAEQARRLDDLSFGSFAPGRDAAGGRPARGRGIGLEFHDFRRYRPGDDLRAVDWAIRARLRQLVVREFLPDAPLRVHLLLDASRSMALGTPSKLATARTVAAAFAYVAIRNRDMVALAAFGRTIRSHIAPAAGRLQLERVLATLQATDAEGASDLNGALMAYGELARGPAAAIVITDAFDARGLFDGLRFLRHRGLTVCVVQVVAPEEMDPAADEDVELLDAEAPAARPVRAGYGASAAYKRRLERELRALTQFCAANGMPRLFVRSSASFEQVLRAAVDAAILRVRG